MSCAGLRSLLIRNPRFCNGRRQFTSIARPHLVVASCPTLQRNGPNLAQTRHNTQHRVVLLPELPSDSAKDNPVLRYKDRLPQLAMVTEANCYYGLGVALIEYEAAVSRMEDCISAGETDYEKLLTEFEESRMLLFTAFNYMNLTRMVTEKLDMDRFTTLTKRVEKAFMTRYDSRIIFDFLNSEAVANVKGEEKILLERSKLESKNIGFELTEKKYLELNGNWMKRLKVAQADARFKIATQTNKFRHIIRDPTVVREFPVDLLRAMAADTSQSGRGPWSVILHPYIYRKFLEYCPDRRLRWNAHTALVSRGNVQQDYMNATGQIRDIRQHMLDVAVTLGYGCYADMSMTTKMAGSVENVKAMIATMHGRARTAQEIELASLQEYAETRGFDDSIREFDVTFFRRKQIRTLFNIEEEAMRDYFPLPHILRSLFQLMAEHYNLVFKLIEPEGPEKPWSEEVSVYEVSDNSGNFKGYCYLDPYIREDKAYEGGDQGWYIPLRAHSDVEQTSPVGCIVMSLATPGFGKPCLLSFNEMEQLFKLVGKAMVHMSAKRKWSETSGNPAEWDAMNVVPDMMTHWLSVPHMVQSFSSHWSNGDQLTMDQAENQILAKKHMAGYSLSQELFKAAYDLSFYSTEYEREQYYALVDRLTDQYLVLKREEDDSFPCHFEEMTTGEYCAGYFSHLWSRMVAADVFSAYHESGWQHPDKIAKVSRNITNVLLSAGSAVPMGEVFRSLRGRDPNPEALMLSLGLSESRAPRQKAKEPERMEQ